MAEMLLSEAAKKAVQEEPRFRGIRPIPNRKIQLQSSLMYEEEVACVREAFRSGPACENVDRLEEEMAVFTGVKYAAAFGSETAAVQMALRLAAEKVYGAAGRDSCCSGSESGNVLRGKRVFCSDLAPAAMAYPVIDEGGEPVFIDAFCEDWGMDPDVLEIAFERYPDVKIVVMAHVYGFPGQIRRIKEICERHGALLIEDACGSLGATISGKPVGSFGDYGVLNFHSDDIMPETAGSMLLTNDFSDIQKVRRWRAESKMEIRQAPKGVCGRMGNAEAGIILSRLRHLEEYIAKKKAIYERYKERFPEDLMLLNPIGEGTEPSYHTPCMTVESGIGFMETRSERTYEYVPQHGTAAPMEILEALEAFGAAGRLVWKPLHMQPFFRECDQITLDGSKREYENSGHGGLFVRCSESADIFRRGICLPADVEMTEEEQDRVIDIILACYSRRELDREVWRE